MLNFTYSSQEVNGQFNGRFVFRAPILAKALTEEDLRAIANAREDALADSALRHEFLHWKVFQHSSVGCSLIGKRYRVRPLFLRGRDASVRTYYTQRTAYFMSAYDTHEEVVDELDKTSGRSIKDLREVLLNEGQKQRIAAADARALELCHLLDAPLVAAELWLDSHLGRLATREFGVQAYLPSDDSGSKTRLYEVALKGESFGIINAGRETAFSTNPPIHVRMARRVLRFGNSERWFGVLTDERLARWVYLKFSTEIRLLESRGNKSSIDAARYVQAMVGFVSRYLGRPSAVSNALVATLLLGTNTHPQEVITERLRLLEHDFLYFFYAHGN